MDGAERTFAGEGGFRSFFTTHRRAAGTSARRSVAPGRFHLPSAKPRPGAMYDGQYNEELFHDATRPRPSRHVASFAASIAAHAAIVGLIVCFAAPVASLPGDWVLAYLVEGTDGASEAASIHAHGGPLATPESVSVDQRKQ